MTSNDDSMDTGEKVFGGCKGSEAKYVKLISIDGHEFIVKQDHATIKAILILSSPGQLADSETNEVNFREIPSHALEKICNCVCTSCTGVSLVKIKI